MLHDICELHLSVTLYVMCRVRKRQVKHSYVTKYGANVNGKHKKYFKIVK